MERPNLPIKQKITRRAWIVYGLFVLFGLIVIGRILHIQYGPESAERRKRAVDSRTFRTSSTDAERGDILAHDGRLLATSLPYYGLRMDFLAAGQTDSIFNRHLDGLSRRMADFFRDKSAQEYKNLLVSYRNLARSGGRRASLIAPRKVSHYELSAIREFPLLSHANPNVSGLVLERDTIPHRSHPYGSLALRTIGQQPLNGARGAGIEEAFDRYLRGQDGVTREQRISGTFWMPVNDENNREPVNGIDVVSTLDIEWQDVADRALRTQLQETGAFWGTAVLMEVATGEIRAMANLTRRADGTCLEDLNHAITQRINPGSTFKLANLIVLLEDAGMSLADTIDINYGRKRVGPRIVEDSHAGPQKMTLREVFLQSSNVGFAQAVHDHYQGERANQQRYVDQLARLGVRDTLPFQIEGLLGPVVHDTRAGTWSDWSLPSMAYGYELEMTPLQMLVLYNTVANGGQMMAPLIVRELQQYGHTVRRYEPRVLRRQITSAATLALVRECLKGVAIEGTARTLKIDGLDIAVKTGTAQVPNRNRGYGRGGAMDYLATLVGYFPADNPKYSLIVSIQTYTGAGGGTVYYGGSLAGPVFRAIAERVYANSPEWNPALAEQPVGVLAPAVVRGGENRRVRQVLDRLDIPYRAEARGNDWITINTDSTGMRLGALAAEAGTVPDVTGMGLQDAVRLLEGRGMSVRFSGMGSVVRQSVAPGEPASGQTVFLTLSTRRN